MHARFVVLAISLGTLSGCNYAAKQVLGTSAVVVNPTKGQRLQAGKIYRVRKDGTFELLCAKDMNNRALRSIAVETVEESSEVLTDQIVGEDTTLTVPGFPTVSIPYDKTRVTGYTVKTANASGGASLYEQIEQGVGSNCRQYLGKSDVIIVESEARAKKTERIIKGPVEDVAIGTAKIEKIGGQSVLRSPSNVTFGVIVARP